MAGKKKNRTAQELDDKQEVYKKIGKRLTQLRKEAGYSAALDFAYENNLHPSQYARYEAGCNMEISSLLNILAAHNITLPQFFAEGF